MGLTQTLLRSRAVAALASPHGVDRYLEQVNPMWAAHEVRARVVDVHREVDVPGHPPVATLTLQPTSTWRGHRAGQHVQVGVEVPGSRRTTRVFTISSPDSRPGDRFTLTMRANPAAATGRRTSTRDKTCTAPRSAHGMHRFAPGRSFGATRPEIISSAKSAGGAAAMSSSWA